MAGMWLVAGIIVIAVGLFVLEIFPVDKTSFLVLAALVLLGLISPEEAVAGFGNAATVTVGCMLGLCLGIERTGALKFLAYRIVEVAGGTEWAVLLAIMLAAGGMSAFINNTAAVAIFLPLCLAVAREQGIQPSRLLMPLSFAAIFGGTCTLIGTSTNLLVHGILTEQLDIQIGLFDIAPLGLLFFVAGSAYLLLLGRHLIPPRQQSGKLMDSYDLRHFVSELALRKGSGLIGRTIADSRLGNRYGIEVLEIWRDGQKHLATEASFQLRQGDILLVLGSAMGLVDVQQSEQGLEFRAMKLTDKDLEDSSIALVEAVVSPTSRLVDSTLKEVNFRQSYQATALALRRNGQPVKEKIGTTRLRAGDSLLLLATREQIETLRGFNEFLVVDEMRVPVVRKAKALWAIAIFLGTVLVSTLGVLSIVEAALVGLGLMLVAGCLRPAEIYSGISWTTIVMLGCLIPLGTALEKSGLASAIATFCVENLRGLGPRAVLSAVYLLTSLLTEVLSNSASAVLMVPIAISIAQQLGVSPVPFGMAVLFAASASFMTPVGYQTNTMVFGPGGYRFADFLKVGSLLNLLFWLIATLGIPLFWPL